MSYIVFDSDDYGANHIISDMCQSHDCRDVLDRLHRLNPNFKATLFTIPAEMTFEMIDWCYANRGWIELAVHGIYHSSNYECEKLTYEEFDEKIEPLLPMIETYFTKGFKAPGWQISDGVYQWLVDHGWWVADQGYNDTRRPIGLPAYVNYNGSFKARGEDIKGIHTHTWNCVGNGIYELFDDITNKIKDETEFRFVSEVI